MKITKQFLAALCAGVMMAGATACGDSSSTSGSSDSAPAESSSAESSEAPESSEASESAESSEAEEPVTPSFTADAYDTEWVKADDALGLQTLNLGMTTDEMTKRAILNQGNRARLANVMKRAQDGEKLTIGVIGGSITQGTGASSSQENYAFRTMAWWVKSFPAAANKIEYVNAGIGATGSYIGVHRAERDLLSKQPDVVIVEFSVNDTDPALNFQTYDSLVRKILNQPNNPAVVMLLMTQEDGTSLAETHKKIGEAYDLPMISYRNAVLPEISAGTFTWKDISPDNIHPNSNGHGIAAELLWHYFNSVLADLDSIDTSDLSFTAPAVSDDRYQNAKICGSDELTPQSAEGFTGAEINQYFPHNWKTETAGTITFEVAARNIGILYQRTIDGKSGQYDVYVDGEFVTTLDGNFPDGWGNYAEAAEVYTSEGGLPHTVTIKLHEGSSAEGFNLLGLLIS
ncbi:MAG: SGNH/GDSL hydrolase family protein [Oscillospiraceae bacterium]|nr:SGNH/GDSL hydrolase family protein [Oscillospiraceae bacterium]